MEKAVILTLDVVRGIAVEVCVRTPARVVKTTVAAVRTMKIVAQTTVVTAYAKTSAVHQTGIAARLMVIAVRGTVAVGHAKMNVDVPLGGAVIAKEKTVA